MNVNAAWRRTCALTVMFALVTLFFLMNRSAGERDDGSILKIGIPDGAAGVIVRYVIDEKMDRQRIQPVRYEPYVLHDCCAGATRFALGSGRLDMAIMCPDAADVLTKKDNRYEIVGPAMQNSDVFITRADHQSTETAIAVSQNRGHHLEMVTRRYGERGKAIPMLYGAVPFAYSKGMVGGAIVDITKAFNLEGEISHSAVKGRAVRTYVMVCKKSVKGSGKYRRFMERYGSAVRETNDSNRLLYLLKNYFSADITMKEVEIWRKLDVNFTHPSDLRQQE